MEGKASFKLVVASYEWVASALYGSSEAWTLAWIGEDGWMDPVRYLVPGSLGLARVGPSYILYFLTVVQTTGTLYWTVHPLVQYRYCTGSYAVVRLLPVLTVPVGYGTVLYCTDCTYRSKQLGY